MTSPLLFDSGQGLDAVRGGRDRKRLSGQQLADHIAHVRVVIDHQQMLGRRTAIGLS
jgi:hypothetical protein